MVKDHSNSKKNTFRHHFMGYSSWLPTRDLLCASSHTPDVGRKEMFLFNNKLNTFYFYLYINWPSDNARWNVLPPLHGIAARDLLYAPYHRQDSTYYCRSNTSCIALAGKRNGSMVPPTHEVSILRPIAPWKDDLPQIYG